MGRGEGTITAGAVVKGLEGKGGIAVGKEGGEGGEWRERRGKEGGCWSLNRGGEEEVGRGCEGRWGLRGEGGKVLEEGGWGRLEDVGLEVKSGGGEKGEAGRGEWW